MICIIREHASNLDSKGEKEAEVIGIVCLSSLVKQRNGELVWLDAGNGANPTWEEINQLRIKGAMRRMVEPLALRVKGNNVTKGSHRTQIVATSPRRTHTPMLSQEGLWSMKVLMDLRNEFLKPASKLETHAVIDNDDSLLDLQHDAKLVLLSILRKDNPRFPKQSKQLLSQLHGAIIKFEAEAAVLLLEGEMLRSVKLDINNSGSVESKVMRNLPISKGIMHVDMGRGGSLNRDTLMHGLQMIQTNKKEKSNEASTGAVGFRDEHGKLVDLCDEKLIVTEPLTIVCFDFSTEFLEQIEFTSEPDKQAIMNQIKAAAVFMNANKKDPLAVTRALKDTVGNYEEWKANLDTRIQTPLKPVFNFEN